MADKEESKELIRRQEVDILELKETLRLRILSEDIEVGIIIMTLSFFLSPSLRLLPSLSSSVPSTLQDRILSV